MADFFVDLSAANNGDGTDGAQAGSPGGAGAWNQLTSTELANVNPGDTVWFRRTGSASTKAITIENGTQVDGRIQYNGWPVDSSDEHYEAAQATSNTVAATWDGDGDDYVVVDPVGSQPTYEYVTFRRIHWEETATGANAAFDTEANSGEFRFYECRASRDDLIPRIGVESSAFGRCEFDRVDVIGTEPQTSGNGSIQMNGGNTVSCYCRVRVTFTDAGSSSDYLVWDDVSATRSWYLEILEWNDAGDNWVAIEDAMGQQGGTWTLTTDDDAVGVLRLTNAGLNSFDASGTCTLRNFTLNHDKGLPAEPVFVSGSNMRRLYLENFEFHPTGHTTQFELGAQDGEIVGRNIKNFDPSKVDGSGLNFDEGNDVAIDRYLHLSQINDTEAWYRRMPGSIAQLSTVNREGGASNAILVEPQPRSIEIQDRGLHGGVFASERKGMEAFAFAVEGLSYPAALTFTAYFAVLHWDDIETEQQIWFEIDHYKNADPDDFTRRLIDSRKLPRSQSFIVDDSTWNEISGENAYRVEIPVTVERDDIVKVRFFVQGSYEDAGAQNNIVVFDPAMTLA